jgi:hypothetical protein
MFIKRNKHTMITKKSIDAGSVRSRTRVSRSTSEKSAVKLTADTNAPGTGGAPSAAELADSDDCDTVEHKF